MTDRKNNHPATDEDTRRSPEFKPYHHPSSRRAGRASVENRTAFCLCPTL
jgi:hypothetical protein